MRVLRDDKHAEAENNARPATLGPGSVCHKLTVPSMGSGSTVSPGKSRKSSVFAPAAVGRGAGPQNPYPLLPARASVAITNHEDCSILAIRAAFVQPRSPDSTTAT